MNANRHIGIATLFLGTIIAATLAAETLDNLIKNGDLEDASLSGWHISKPDDATCELQSVDTPVKGGKKALLLQGKGPWMSAYTAKVAVNSKATYKASAWIRTKKGHAYIEITHWENDKWLGTRKAQQRVVNDEWSEMSIETDQEKMPSTTHLSVGITSDGPDVEVYIDDVLMAEVKVDPK